MMQTAQAAIIDQLRGLATKLVDGVLPAQCISCFEFTAQPGRLCADCWNELSFIDHPLCDRTGIPFAFDPGEGIISARALARPPVWHRARAAVEFNDMSRKLIHALKYYDRHEVVAMMSHAMARAGRELINEADMIIPVPLYPLRLWQRRFNQSAALAKHIAHDARIEFCTDILKRRRSTRQQVGLSGSERRKNVKNAFTIEEDNTNRLFGAKVVLVDDVVTTGATVGACSEILLNAGCEQVDVLTFALVNNPLQLHI